MLKLNGAALAIAAVVSVGVPQIGIADGDRDLGKRMATLTKKESSSKSGSKARLAIAELLARHGELHRSLNYLDEIVANDGAKRWATYAAAEGLCERILLRRLGSAEPDLYVKLKVEIDTGTPLFQLSEGREMSGAVAEPVIWEAGEIKNGRVRVWPPSYSKHKYPKSAWVKLGGKGVTLAAVQERQRDSEVIEDFGALKYLSCADCCRKNIAEVYEDYTFEHSKGDYLHLFRNGRYIEQAKRAVEEYWFQRGENARMPEHQEMFYKDYKLRYPDGRFAAQADKKLAAMREGRDYSLAKEQDDVDAYRSFLESHASGPHSDEARSLLEERLARSLRYSGDLDECARFLGEFPSSKFRDIVEARMEHLEYREVKKSTYASVYRSFLSKYPNGKHAAEARRFVRNYEARYRFRSAKSSESELRDFLKVYDDTSYASDARARIAWFEVSREPTLQRLRTFFSRSKKARSGTISNEDRKEVLRALAELGMREQSFDAFLLLFDEVKTSTAFEELKKLVKTRTQEAELVSRAPQLYFVLGPGRMGTEYTGATISLLLNQHKTAKPEISLPVRSKAQLGTYYVEAVVTVELTFQKKYSGLLARDRVEYETKKVTAGASAVLEPGGSDTFDFVLPKVTGFDETGANIVAKVVTRFVEDESKIESVEFTKTSLR